MNPWISPHTFHSGYHPELTQIRRIPVGNACRWKFFLFSVKGGMKEDSRKEWL